MDIYMETKDGRAGRVIDIMVDEGFDGNNKILMLLEFEDDGDWMTADDLEPCDHG